MKNKPLFNSFLHEYHQKVVKIFLFKQLQYLLGVIALATAIIFIAARFIVIVEWKALVLVASILACAFVAFRVYKQRPTKFETVRAYNEWIANDYVITTYELNPTHTSYPIILSKTEDLMKQEHPKIMAIKLPIWNQKWVSILVICLTITFFSYYVPSETQKTAIQQQEVKELIKETEDSLEELKDLTEDEEKKELINLTEEKLGELQNVEEIVQQLEQLNAEINLQLLKEFDEMALLQQIMNSPNESLQGLKDVLQNKNVSQLKDQLANMDRSTLSSAEQSLVEKLEQLNLTEQQLTDLLEGKWEEHLASKLNEIGKQVERTAKQIDPTMLTNFQGNIAQAPSNPSDATNEGQQNPSSSSQTNPSTNGAGSGSSSQTGPPQNGSQSGSSGSSGGSNGSQSGSSGSSGGSNGSQGGLQGSQGQGQSSGQIGSGMGTGQGSRDLTLPSRIVGEHSIEIDAGNLSNGQQGTIFESEGLAVKGQIQNYEQVVNAYESVNENTANRTPLPSNLADLVKQYFSNME